MAKQQPYKSKIPAREWARMAREKGLTQHARAWEEADHNGWDAEHFEGYVPAIGYRADIDG